MTLIKKSKLNIIIVNDFAHINGGAAKVALTSAISLAENGYSVTLFSSVLPVMPELQNKKKLSIICTEQYEIIKNPSRAHAITQGIWNIKAAKQMSILLDDFDKTQTVIHVHGWSKALSSSPIRKAIKRGFKVICTLHDYFSACPNGGFFNYQSNHICYLKPLSIQCIRTHCDVRSYPQKLWRVARQLVQDKIGLMPNGIHHFITISKFSHSVLTPYLPKCANVYHIDNPIPIEQESPVNVGNNQAFVMVGRVSKEKGAGLFAKATQALSVQGVVVGDGPYMKELQAVAPNLEYLGWQSEKVVKVVLRKARALVLPSLCYENQPLIVLEAMALGVPVIVPDTSAARDLIVDNETGLWFKGGDAENLQRKMKSLIDNPKFSAKLGNAAYQYFWDNPPTLSKHIEHLLSIYEKVIR